MKMIAATIGALILPMAVGAQTAPQPPAEMYVVQERDGPSPVAYDPARDATADVNAALAAARTSRKSVLIVLGGSWCHDSMALVDLFAQPRFEAMLRERYELVWVDVGHRDRNLDIATRFGLGPLEGTPTVLILNADGVAQNLADAPRWRNAASRKANAIYRHFQRAAAPVAAR